MSVSAAISAFGLVQSHQAARKQERAAKKAFEAQERQREEQKRIADIKAARDKRKLLREARIQKAAIALTQQGDSRAQGAAASIGTQTASATGFIGQQQQASTTIFEQGTIIGETSVDLAKARTQAQLGSTLFDLGVSGKAKSAVNWATGK